MFFINKINYLLDSVVLELQDNLELIPILVMQVTY